MCYVRRIAIALGSSRNSTGFAWSVEYLQLYHAPWIDAIRSTRLGRLVLGSVFNSPDLLAYVIGIALGALAEYVFLNTKQKTMRCRRSRIACPVPPRGSRHLVPRDWARDVRPIAVMP